MGAVGRGQGTQQRVHFFGVLCHPVPTVGGRAAAAVAATAATAAGTAGAAAGIPTKAIPTTTVPTTKAPLVPVWGWPAVVGWQKDLVQHVEQRSTGFVQRWPRQAPAGDFFRDGVHQHHRRHPLVDPFHGGRGVDPVIQPQRRQQPRHAQHIGGPKPSDVGVDFVGNDVEHVQLRRQGCEQPQP